MLTTFTLICALSTLALPTLMITITYPFSHKAALFWSNYITRHCARMLFSIFSCYRGFNFLGDKKSKSMLPDQFIILSNHQSLLDIVVYLKYFVKEKKVRFVAKDALGKVPMVGKMLRSQGHCMIPRKGSPTVAMQHIDAFGKRVMENDFCPLIFPEGTRSRDGNLRSFYAAGFRRLSQTTGLPVAVCALDGGWQIRDLKTLFKSLHHGSYRVKVLKVFPSPKTKEEEKQILEESRELIQKQLDEWRSLGENSTEV